MTKPSLSVYPATTSSDHHEGLRQHELDRISGAAAPKTVTLPVGKLLPLLIDAARHQRAWLSDFADDPVRIDADLYDVLLAYQQLREKAA
ncbi:MAG: hypothetical protein MI861_12640 [Pirellulales bacterium]|nr:hypothetical protein [Pirellulales bacterium]